MGTLLRPAYPIAYDQKDISHIVVRWHRDCVAYYAFRFDNILVIYEEDLPLSGKEKCISKLLAQNHRPIKP